MKVLQHIFLHTKNALKVIMYIAHTSIYTHLHDMQDKGA